MADPIGNPYDKKDEVFDRKRNFRYRTRYYDLLLVEDRAGLQDDLNRVVNDNNKYGIIEFSVGSKVDGSPYIISRYREDLDLTEKNSNWFSVHIRLFAHYQFEEMDELINQHDNRTLRLLGEKRFVYKTGEVCDLLVWSEIRSMARSQEALDVIRKVFNSKL